MKKKTLTNVLLKAIIILMILLISIISFFGIYKRNLNKWENVLPEINLSKELSEVRTFGFIVDNSTEKVENKSSDTEQSSAEGQSTGESTTEENATGEETAVGEANSSQETEESQETEIPVNDPNVLTAENYKKSKEIIEKRLKRFGLTDTIVTVDEKSGNITVEAPFGKATDYVSDIVTNTGKIEVVDTETKEVLMDNSMIKKVVAYYAASESSTADNPLYDIGVRLDVNTEGQKKLNEISKIYIETTNEDGETTQKAITVRISGEDKYETYFSTEGTYTYLAIPLFSSVDANDLETVNNNYNECLVNQAILNEGVLPVKYEISTGTYIESNLGNNFVLYVVIAEIVVLVLVNLIIIKKFGKNGIMATIMQIGYIAILLLLLRVANVSITLSGLITILFMALINYLLIIMLMKKEKLLQLGKFLLNIIPLIITIIVFNFAKDVNILSVGMVAFWGLITLIYTFIVSLILLNTNKNGVE